MKTTTIGALSALTLVLSCSSETLTTTGLDPVPVSPESTQDENTATDPLQPVEEDSSQAEDPSEAQDSPSSEGDLPENLAPGAGDDDDDPILTPIDEQEEEEAQPEEQEEEAEPEEEVRPPLTPGQVGGQLEGFLHLSPCESQDFGHDCTLPMCAGGAKIVERTLQLGGDPGVVYDITIHVYGIVEPRSYQGGVRRAGNNFNANGTDFWYEGGGLPGNVGTYNSYEMHVDPPVPGAANDYYLNSRTGGDQTWVIRLDYEATFPVVGGGTIEWRSFDPNCRQITNCDDQECGPVGPKPLTLPRVNNADPPPAMLQQPYRTSAGAGLGQWVYIDVLDAVARE